MRNFDLRRCPVCGEKLVLSRLTCPDCKAEFPTDMPLSPYDSLPESEREFLTAFLTCRGNMKEVQDLLGISYPTAKKRLDALLDALGLNSKKAQEKQEDMIMFQKKNEDSVKASDIIRNKLYENGGMATVTLLRGGIAKIKALPDGERFSCDKLSLHDYKYEVFDIIVDFLLNQGGEARKGNGRYRFGYGECTEDTVAGTIAKEYFGKKVGESTFEPVFALAAILDWAGIAKNGYSTIKLTSDYMILRREGNKG